MMKVNCYKWSQASAPSGYVEAWQSTDSNCSWKESPLLLQSEINGLILCG